MYGTTSSGGPALVNAWSAKSAVPFFRVGNYAPVFDELTTFDLPVEGAFLMLRLTELRFRYVLLPRRGSVLSA